MDKSKKAVVLLSGGLDSTVVLAMAIQQGIECEALSFDYGQRHRIELNAAAVIAAYYAVPHRMITLTSFALATSALISDQVALPKNRSPEEMNKSAIPSSYVPARNTLFLAYALGHAELIYADEIHVGFNAADQNAYPDCRPEFLKAFQQLIQVATKQSVEGKVPLLKAPLISYSKREIIQHGLLLKAPLDLSFSCYDPTPQNLACGACDACILRTDGFLTAV